MAARLLDGGRYVVLWPTDAPLRTCGQQFVVDAYQQGELYLLDEVGDLLTIYQLRRGRYLKHISSCC